MVSSKRLATKNHWRAIWQGHGKVRPGIVSLLWATLRFFLASWLWRTAVRLAHSQTPTKSIAVVLALGSMLLIIWALWGGGHAFFILGFKRCVLFITLVFVSLVTINVLTIPDTRPIGSRFVTQVSATTEQIWNTLSNWSRYHYTGPEQFLICIFGPTKDATDTTRISYP